MRFPGEGGAGGWKTGGTEGQKAQEATGERRSFDELFPEFAIELPPAPAEDRRKRRWTVLQRRKDNYAMSGGSELGLVINFGDQMVKEGIHRVVDGL